MPIGDSKDRQRYSDGEIFYDRQEKTLRIYDGIVKGGYKLATEQYVIDNQNLQNIDSDVVPATANTYNLGSPTNPWKSLYVSTNTIYIGGVAVGVDNGNLTVGDNGNAVNLATEDYVSGQGFITTSALYWNNISSKPVFSTVATSGSYNDLTNKPTLFSGSYNDLTNKPTLFSGSYNDLTNKPTIPTTTSQLINNSGFITSSDVAGQIQADWSQSNVAEPDYIRNKPAIPTNTNQLSNGAGFVTETYVNTAIANLVDSSPATLDTLNELAAALGDDPNFATTMSNNIGLKAPINNPTFTGTVSGITATMVGLGNVTNESKATMFTSPTFTGTVSGVTATHVGLGNVTNESKATMFTSPTFTESVNLNSSVDGYVANITGNGTSLGLKLDNSNLSSSALSIITVAGGDAGQNVSLVAGGAAGKTSLEVDAADFHLRVAQPNKDIYIDVNYNQTALKISGADKSTTFYGTLTTQQSTEVLNTKTAATGSVIHDFSTGAIWYHSSISANFEPIFTNVPETNNRTIVCTLILNQGATAYIPSSIRVNSSGMLPPKWLGGTAPTGNANTVNIVSFTLIRTGSAWTVLGSLSSYG